MISLVKSLAALLVLFLTCCHAGVERGQTKGIPPQLWSNYTTSLAVRLGWSVDDINAIEGLGALVNATQEAGGTLDVATDSYATNGQLILSGIRVCETDSTNCVYYVETSETYCSDSEQCFNCVFESAVAGNCFTNLPTAEPAEEPSPSPTSGAGAVELPLLSSVWALLVSFCVVLMSGW